MSAGSHMAAAVRRRVSGVGPGMSNESSAVTVVMPAYNSERFIGQAIDSLLAQTFEDFSVLVIDDGSDDRTREIVRAYADTRVRMTCNASRVGAAASRN